MIDDVVEDVERGGVARPWPASRAARWPPASRRLPTRGCRRRWRARPCASPRAGAPRRPGSVRGSAGAGWPRGCDRDSGCCRAALTMAAMVRWPSVVVPMSTILHAVRLRRRRARSTCSISSAVASRPSVPMRKPKCASGVGDLRRRAGAPRAGARPRQAGRRGNAAERLGGARRPIMAPPGTGARSVAPRCDAGIVPELERRADAARVPPARCRAARRGRGRGRAALRAGPWPPRRRCTRRRPMRCRAGRRRGDRARPRWECGRGSDITNA